MMSTTNNNDDENTPLQRKSDGDGGGGVDPQTDTTTTCFSPTVQTFLIDSYETNHFLIKAILAIVLARLYPPLGAQILHPAITGQWMAVMFIFCMAGISIKTSELGIAFTRWKFNIFVLGFNFFGLSFIVYCVTQLLLKYDLLNEGMANGMIVCSCMPMSVSMVVVFTRTAMGETASASLLTTMSSLISVFVSPLLILFYTGSKTQIDLPSVIIKLLLRVLLPMIIGQLLQTFVKSVVTYVDEHRNFFKRTQEYALIYIVYTVFCKTFEQSFGAGLMDIVLMACFQFALLCICKFIAWILLKLLFRDSPRLRVMGIYGCVQKSAAVGIPLIGAIYENNPTLAGLYTLPLLIWHPSQMLLGSALVPHLAAGVQKLEAHLSSVDNEGGSSRQSFFGSKTKVKASRRTSKLINDALGAVAYECSDKLITTLNDSIMDDNRASAIANNKSVEVIV